jgi:hypothetical protein
MQAPKQPLMLYVNDKIYLPNPAEPGAFVPASPEAAAALDAKDAEIVALRQALGGADSAMKLAEGVIVSKRELFALAQAREAARAALSATTKE